MKFCFMRNKENDYQRLFHIVKYCEKLKAIKLSMNSNYDTFSAKCNYEKVDVSSFYIGQIGELTHGLTDELKNSYTDIPWKQINDMRNVLVHHYGERSVKIIWDVIERDIPILENKCRSILKMRNRNVDSEIKNELIEETNIFD